jgi:hypothetical protein
MPQARLVGRLTRSIVCALQAGTAGPLESGPFSGCCCSALASADWSDQPAADRASRAEGDCAVSEWPTHTSGADRTVTSGADRTVSAGAVDANRHGPRRLGLTSIPRRLGLSSIPRRLGLSSIPRRLGLSSIPRRQGSPLTTVRRQHRRKKRSLLWPCGTPLEGSPRTPPPRA